MKEYPVIFQGWSVRAILEGRKTQTRRVIKNTAKYQRRQECLDRCPYGQPGDLLWVRETWMPETEDGTATGSAIYQATDKPSPDGDTPLRWRPSIYMPRWASRLTLRITDVRVQRVQEITEEDAKAEGIIAHDKGGKERIGRVMYAARPGDHNEWELSARSAYARLWDSINAKRGYSWESNSFVWAISFEKTASRLFSKSGKKSER